MVIAFSTKKLRKLCESESFAKRVLGDIVAAKLRHRLADLESVEKISELVAGNPTETDHEGTTHILLHLHQNIGMLLAQNHEKPPLNSSRKVDWSKVTRVKLVALE